MGKAKMQILHPHICERCGGHFLSLGTMAKYCPECKKEVKRKGKKQYSLTAAYKYRDVELNDYQKKYIEKAIAERKQQSGGEGFIKWQENEPFNKQEEKCRWCGEKFKPYSEDGGIYRGRLFCCIKCASAFNLAARVVCAKRKESGKSAKSRSGRGVDAVKR